MRKPINTKIFLAVGVATLLTACGNVVHRIDLKESDASPLGVSVSKTLSNNDKLDLAYMKAEGKHAIQLFAGSTEPDRVGSGESRIAHGATILMGPQTVNVHSDIEQVSARYLFSVVNKTRFFLYLGPGFSYSDVSNQFIGNNAEFTASNSLTGLSATLNLGFKLTPDWSLIMSRSAIFVDEGANQFSLVGRYKHASGFYMDAGYYALDHDSGTAQNVSHETKYCSYMACPGMYTGERSEVTNEYTGLGVVLGYEF